MQSAFVDIGLEKDAFLYVADVGDEVEDFDRFGASEEDSGALEPEPAAAESTGGDGENGSRPIPPSIDELLREGQELVVQVTKDQIAHKGVRITTHVTLPGRTLVYMPTIDHIGISRRIENEEERARLKEILTTFRKGPGGYIVRTAGEGRTADEFASDRRYLTRLWDQIRKKGERSGAPTLLHRDLDLTLRAARDVFGSDFATLWLDEDEEYQRVVEFLDQVQPSARQQGRGSTGRPRPSSRSTASSGDRERPEVQGLAQVGRVHRHQPDRGARRHRRQHREVRRQEAARGHGRQDEPGGGAGDRPPDPPAGTSEGSSSSTSSTWRRKGTGGSSWPRWRRSSRRTRSKNRMLPVSEFGLVEITRKRQRHSLERSLTMPCPYCAGSGRVKQRHHGPARDPARDPEEDSRRRGPLPARPGPPGALPLALHGRAPDDRGARGADRHPDPRPERTSTCTTKVRHRPRDLRGVEANLAGPAWHGSR